MSERLNTLQNIINDAVARGSRDLYTLIPAKVVKWDASIQRADCQILIQDVTEAEDGSREVASMAVVPGVPVQFPGSGTFRMTFPVSDGSLVIEGATAPATTGSLVFSHRSLDKWLTGRGGEVDPEFDHDHAPADAVFFPGLMPFGAPLSSCPTTQASIGSDSDGNGRVHFKTGEVLLGDGATKEVARKGDGVGAGTLEFTFGAGSGAATLSIVYTPGDGGAIQTLVAGTGTITIGEKITGGSDHIKAVD